MILICKKCGGRIEVNKDDKICECEYCGSTQTVPNLDEDKRLNLFNRANNLRLKSDFDNAIIAYQNILTEYPDDSEAHFGLFLSKYGIEYVKDPQTESLIPTCHRLTTKDVLKDEDYLAALKNADVVSKGYYQMEGKEISRILKEILALSQKEEPYDIFISYKETDELTGERSIDSLVASKLYDALVAKKYKVFFSRISLENRLGEAYEPIIYSALRSSKVMLCVGTNVENFNAVWVKNEWSRYLAFIENEPTKHLIPCYKDMDPYDLPKEFKHLQAQDLNKVGALEDLLRGIDKIFKGKKETVSASTKPVTDDKHFNNLYNRILITLESKDFEEALRLSTNFLDEFPDYPHGFILKICATEELSSLELLKTSQGAFLNNPLFKSALLVASDSDKEKLLKLKETHKAAVIEKIHKLVDSKLNLVVEDLNEALRLVNSLKEEKEYKALLDYVNYEPAFNRINELLNKNQKIEAFKLMKELGAYRDCAKWFNECLEGNYKMALEVYEREINERNVYDFKTYIKECVYFNYADARKLDKEYQERIYQEILKVKDKDVNLAVSYLDEIKEHPKYQELTDALKFSYFLTKGKKELANKKYQAAITSLSEISTLAEGKKALLKAQEAYMNHILEETSKMDNYQEYNELFFNLYKSEYFGDVKENANYRRIFGQVKEGYKAVLMRTFANLERINENPDHTFDLNFDVDTYNDAMGELKQFPKSVVTKEYGNYQNYIKEVKNLTNKAIYYNRKKSPDEKTKILEKLTFECSKVDFRKFGEPVISFAGKPQYIPKGVLFIYKVICALPYFVLLYFLYDWRLGSLLHRKSYFSAAILVLISYFLYKGIIYHPLLRRFVRRK